MMGILEAVIDRVRLRQQRYEHRECLLDQAPLEALSRLGPVLVGECSAIAYANSLRLIHRPALISVDGTKETATALARDYLRVKFPEGRVDGRHVPVEIQRVPEPFAPYFCAGFRSGYFVYIDLKAAYWSIVRRVGWRCVYRPGRYLGKEGSVADFPWPGNRLARNALVTNAAPGRRRVMERGKVREEFFRNPLLNYPLLNVVSDTLHAIAADMRDLGAIHIHTDGYIFDSIQKAEQAMAFLQSEWGLTASVRVAGPGIIKAPGAWRIGMEETETFQVVRVFSAGIDNIREVKDRLWLRRTFAQLGAYEEEV